MRTGDIRGVFFFAFFFRTEELSKITTLSLLVGKMRFLSVCDSSGDATAARVPTLRSVRPNMDSLLVCAQYVDKNSDDQQMRARGRRSVKEGGEKRDRRDLSFGKPTPGPLEVVGRG